MYVITYVRIVATSADTQQAITIGPRVKALRETMREGAISDDVPLVMAGGVWYLRDWHAWLDNPALGAPASQFGTRPLRTRQSPLPQAWKDKLTTLDEGDILLHRFSPTGFYSSAVRTPFLRNLEDRSERQIAFSLEQAGDHTHQLDVGVKGKNFWVMRGDLMRAREWTGQGFEHALKTPDNTLIFVTDTERKVIRKDQTDCMGCLSHCGFSSWKDHDDYSTGYLADPRSFCIQKTLQDIAHGGDTEQNLMFAGHAAFRFQLIIKRRTGAGGVVHKLGQAGIEADHPVYIFLDALLIMLFLKQNHGRLHDDALTLQFLNERLAVYALVLGLGAGLGFHTFPDHAHSQPHQKIHAEFADGFRGGK